MSESKTPTAVEALTRPIMAIENRTPQEVFDIMADRIRAALAAESVEPVAVKPLDAEAMGRFALIVDDVLDMAIYLPNCDADLIGHYQEAANRLARFHSDLARTTHGEADLAEARAEIEQIESNCCIEDAHEPCGPFLSLQDDLERAEAEIERMVKVITSIEARSCEVPGRHSEDYRHNLGDVHRIAHFTIRARSEPKP